VPEPGTIIGAPSGQVVTLEATILRADGTVVPLGVIASSDPEIVPVTPREDAS
jgi:hypothetical protein